MSEKVHSSDCNNSKILLEQVTGQLQDKDLEINQLKETIDFTETSVSEAKLNWEEETSKGLRLQGLLNEEKKLRVQAEEECCSLQTQLPEEKVKFERHKLLSQIDNVSSNKEPLGEVNSRSAHLNSGRIMQSHWKQLNKLKKQMRP